MHTSIAAFIVLLYPSCIVCDVPSFLQIKCREPGYLYSIKMDI